MYEYDFVKVELKSGFVKQKPKENYHQIIIGYASKGWRLVQIFDPGISGYGAAAYFELIFERPIDKV